MRDAVEYRMIASQKKSAWAIDTTIEGSQSDVDNYVASMEALGTIPNAGSEFAHTSKIKREMVSPQDTAGGDDGIFDWCLSMICASVQIPVNYMGTHLNGGATRASAVVATEPVAKKFQMRQLYIERIILKMGERLSDLFGIQFDMEIVFPELITQDRSEKLRDLALATQSQWISKETAAKIAAKEFGISSYKYEDEQKKIDAEQKLAALQPKQPNELTQPNPLAQDKVKSSAITSDERREITKNARR